MQSLVLDNGFTILHEPRPHQSIGMCLMVRVGALGETSKISGISHFIEHMLFEGTRKRSAYDIAYAVEKVGGEINAYTAQDRTCITARTLRKHLDDVLDVVHDVVTHPLFARDSVTKERSVVLSEIAMRRDEPRCLQWDLLTSRLFKGTKAALPVLGTKSSVSSLTSQNLADFFRSHYHPSNMILSIVGGLRKDVERVKSLFSTLHGRQKPDEYAPVPVRQKKRTSHRSLRNHQSYLMLGVRAPPSHHPDAPVFEVIRAILARGMSGRLFNEIRIKRGLGYDVGAHFVSGAFYSLFVANAVASATDITECERLLRANLAGIASVSSQDIRDAKAFLEAERIFEQEDQEQYADTLAYAWYAGVDISAYDKAIQAVSRDDVARVAKEYLSGPFTRVCLE